MKDLTLHQDLIERCKKGEREAQYRLYRMYSKAMYNICLRMLKNEMDAEDVLQNSFIDIFTKLGSYRYQSTPGAWIKRIVINNCINHIKKSKIYLEDFDDQLLTIPEEEIDPKVLNVAGVKKAIEQLPNGYRIVFNLYAIEGYDHKEIAEILGITEATSKSQYSRARKKLKDKLMKESTNGVIYE